MATEYDTNLSMTSFHGDQTDGKQSSMMKMWNMFSGKLSGGTESMYVRMYVPNEALCLQLPSLPVTFRCGCFAKGDFGIGGNESAVIYGICGHAFSEGKVPCTVYILL